ncbi:MAG TPA: ABC transporter permease [Actinomycetota bacterium]|nr:ABC transporter permease [Actinomycetota bacterium]
MTGLIRSELRKWWTTRMWFGLTLGGMLAVAVITLITALTAGSGGGDNGPVTPPLSDPAQVRTVYGTAFGIGSLFTLILGVIAICGEFRHQTITATFLASPRRSRVVQAKVVSIVLVSAMSGILMIATGLLVGAIVISARGFQTRLGSGDIQQALVLMLLGLVVWSVLGLGVGTLLKNQVAAILVVVGFTFIAEPLLQVGLNALGWFSVSKFLPGQATMAMVRTTGEHLQSWWGGTLTLLLYAAVAAALGTFLALRRDVS